MSWAIKESYHRIKETCPEVDGIMNSLTKELVYYLDRGTLTEKEINYYIDKATSEIKSITGEFRDKLTTALDEYDQINTNLVESSDKLMYLTSYIKSQLKHECITQLHCYSLFQ